MLLWKTDEATLNVEEDISIDYVYRSNPSIIKPR